MGMLKISKALLKDENISIPLFYWLDKQCKAIIEDITIPSDIYYRTYHVEGDGIPKEKNEFSIQCTCLVANVLLFEII